MPVLRLPRTRIAAALVLGVALAAPTTAVAAGERGDDHRPPRTFAYAVYGDAPYGTSPTDTSQTEATPAFVAAVNADRAVSGVLHVGDIHSGSQYCTQAYDQQVADLWRGFTDPLVYTPGDNEWADCHKKKEGGGVYNPATGQVDYVTDASGAPADYAGGNPVDNLALVRSTFFPQPGRTSAAAPCASSRRHRSTTVPTRPTASTWRTCSGCVTASSSSPSTYPAARTTAPTPGTAPPPPRPSR